MKQILAEGGIRLTKSLGQNFLHDGNQLRRMVQAADLSNADKVLEIGPGLGSLTDLLLAQAGEVLAIEKDGRLVKALEQRFTGAKNLALLHADALEYLQDQTRDWSDWKLVTNLPYSVASPILVELAQNELCPRRTVVTLQLEVSQRLVAEPGNRDYGVLSLLVQLRYAAKGFFKIPASCFFPEPEVDSACITLSARPCPLLAPEQSRTFAKIVKRSFSQRRKMMVKLLKEDWPPERLATAFRHLHLASQVRAETVGLEQFVELTRLLDQRTYPVPRQ